MKEISIIGATFYGNRGAEGMLSTTIGELKNKYGDDLHFNVFSYYPQRDRKLITDRAIHIYSSTPSYLVAVLLPSAFLFQVIKLLHFGFLSRFLPESIVALNRSVALVCVAGVSFIEGRSKFIPFNIATILPAVILGVPVVKFAQAMGPFKSFINRSAARVFLGCCHQIFTRGEQTQAHLHELLGRLNNFQRSDDIAFLFRNKYCISKPATGLKRKLKALHGMKRNTGKSIVGFCPSVVIADRTTAAGWDYLKYLQTLLEGLVDQGWIVAFYPNATRGDDMDKTHNNDLPLINTILHNLRPDVKKQIIGFTGSYNIGQIHEIISACDIQLVSRFHAMVASLVLSVPVMVVGWSHKYVEVMKRFRQQDMVFEFSNGDVKPLLAKLNQLFSERVERTAQIKAALPEVQRNSSKQIVFLTQLLKKAYE